MESILALFAFIEKYPVTGAAIMSLVVAGIIGILKALINRATEKNKFPYIKPYYWGSSKNFYITTVLEQFPNDDPSGYRQVQYSRPDLWEKKVRMISYLGIFHKIVPVNKDDVLVVLVTRRWKPKHVLFNKVL